MAAREYHGLNRTGFDSIPGAALPDQRHGKQPGVLAHLRRAPTFLMRRLRKTVQPFLQPATRCRCVHRNRLARHPIGHLLGQCGASQYDAQIRTFRAEPGRNRLGEKIEEEELVLERDAAARRGRVALPEKRHCRQALHDHLSCSVRHTCVLCKVLRDEADRTYVEVTGLLVPHLLREFLHQGLELFFGQKRPRLSIQQLLFQLSRGVLADEGAQQIVAAGERGVVLQEIDNPRKEDRLPGQGVLAFERACHARAACLCFRR